MECVRPDGEMFDARMQALSEYVKLHVREQQNEVLPTSESPRMNLADLGEKIAARRAELLAQRSEA
jgi:hypothetical protein